MTNLTVAEVYAIGVPIVLAMILVESIFSNLNKKSYYKQDDTLCTVGLLAGNMFMAFAIKGLTLALHFYLYDFRIFDLHAYLPYLVYVVSHFYLNRLGFLHLP
jgi:hypothetical protein